MINLSHKKAGMTLLELMVSMIIGLLIVLSLFSVLHVGTVSYKATATQMRESKNAQGAFTLLRQDLSRRHHRLPLSLGQGKFDKGWDLVSGESKAWPLNTGYGVDFPSESLNSWASDRVGFYTLLPPELAIQYGGKNIAHVLYFTAVAHRNTPEVLETEMEPSALGYSRNLYRYYTPPDLVFERLNLDNEESIIPRGANSVSDEKDSAGILSLVADGIARFQVTLSARYNDGGSELFISDLGELLAKGSITETSETLTSLLSKTEPLTPSPITLDTITFDLLVVPTPLAKRLRSNEWNILGVNQSIGNSGIVPQRHQLSTSLIK